MTYPTRKIGQDTVASIGFGAMGLSAFYGTIPSDEENLKVIHKAIDLVQPAKLMIDTADMYGQEMGDNEKLLSKALKDPKEREKVYIATKFANYKEHGTQNRSIRGSKEYVREAIEKSLAHLQLDFVDLYYQHRVDRTIQIEETWEELKKLKEEGKVRNLGISEATPDEIRRAHAVTPITACQIEFSPWTPNIRENGILSTCRELGITIVPYSPLGRGFLTGQYKSIDDFEEGDFRKYNPRFSEGDNFKKNYAIVEEMQALANKKNCTPGQLALSWILAQGDDFIPIPGTKRQHCLIENMKAVDVKLSKEEIKDIDDLIAKIPAVGDRYPGAFAAASAF